MTVMIEFTRVTKMYRTVMGVNDISLQLKPGAYGLLGPNGSGKTTLINLLLGQLYPTLGRVRLFGENPMRRSDLLRRIGLCPTVHPELINVTAWEWVNFLLRQHGYSRAEARARAAASLERVGMTAAMHRAMSGYSLGMRQRSKMAQAIAHDPELLILDEPFNGLDPVARHEMTELMRDMVRQGKSVILASHVLHEVEAIRPAYLLLSGGRLLASGSAHEVREMLTDCPSTILVRCGRRQRLLSLLWDIPEIDSVRLGKDAESAFVSTRSSGAVYRRLPQWNQEHDLQIHEIRSADSSLQQLFSTLMQIHRGQSRTARAI
jgi:ABC-2 type transport system ATP-binding protein